MYKLSLHPLKPADLWPLALAPALAAIAATGERRPLLGGSGSWIQDP